MSLCVSLALQSCKMFSTLFHRSLQVFQGMYQACIFLLLPQCYIPLSVLEYQVGPYGPYLLIVMSVPISMCAMIQFTYFILHLCDHLWFNMCRSLTQKTCCKHLSDQKNILFSVLLYGFQMNKFCQDETRSLVQLGKSLVDMFSKIHQFLCSKC